MLILSHCLRLIAVYLNPASVIASSVCAGIYHSLSYCSLLMLMVSMPPLAMFIIYSIGCPQKPPSVNGSWWRDAVKAFENWHKNVLHETEEGVKKSGVRSLLFVTVLTLLLCFSGFIKLPSISAKLVKHGMLFPVVVVLSASIAPILMAITEWGHLVLLRRKEQRKAAAESLATPKE